MEKNHGKLDILSTGRDFFFRAQAFPTANQKLNEHVNLSKNENKVNEIKIKCWIKKLSVEWEN